MAPAPPSSSGAGALDGGDAALAALGRGDARRAFEIADRLCRTAPCRDPRHRLVRSFALDALGFAEDAAEDLDGAAAEGWSDPLVLRALVARHRDPSRRRAAALASLRLARATADDVSAARAALARDGEALWLVARRDGTAVSGWVDVVGGERPTVWLRGADGAAERLAVTALVGPAGAPGVTRHAFAGVAAGTVELTARTGSGATGPLTLAARDAAPTARRAEPGRAPALTVVIPVYGDPDSLADCLDALRAQAIPDTSVVVIDDASPFPAVSRLGRDFCLAMGGTYRRRPLNAGYAASVNHALALVPDGDVLILNSDVVLPGEALARLRAAARAEPGIGTVSPLSNDAGCATFPDPSRPMPPVTPARAAAIDAAAWGAHPCRVADVVTSLGSCLYVTRACLDRIGPLSLAYGRGYYEDVELCLRAREAGFRNVAALGIYVSHVGGRSFGAARAALVARNRAVLDARFPRYALAGAAFDEADPLRRARSAIEERLVPTGAPVALIVGRRAADGARLAATAAAAGAAGRFALVADWRDGSATLALAGPAGAVPQSLAFGMDRDGAARLGAYLARLHIASIEIAEPDALPPALVAVLHGFGAKPSRLDDDEPDAGVAAECRPRRADPIARLGVSMPACCPAGDALVLALGRALRGGRRPTRLIVLGGGIDAAQLMSPGDVWVSGPADLSAEPALASHYGLDALLVPRRGPSAAELDTARRLGLPAAWFGPSRAGSAAGGDLVLDGGMPDLEACASIVSWCGAPTPAVPC